MKKPDGVKVLSVVAMLVGAAGTLLSDISREKTMDKTIKEEVEKALSNKK